MNNFITKMICMVLFCAFCMSSVFAQTERFNPNPNKVLTVQERIALEKKMVPQMEPVLPMGMMAPTSDLYYANSSGAVRKGTVATPYPGTSVGTNGNFLQCFEYHNGQIYAIRWSGGNSLGTINQTTGAWTTIASTIPGCDGAALCHNPANGLTYVFPFTGEETEGTQWGTISLTTGAFTSLGTYPTGGTHTYHVAIDNDGVAYAVRGTSNEFGTINLTTGVFTPTATLPITANYVQGMDFDRETGQLYWMAQSLTDFSGTRYYQVNKSTGGLTLSGTDAGSTWSCFTTMTIPGDPCPAVTNVNATAVDANVTITWTAATGSPTGYQVYRGATLVGTTTATTYLDTNVPKGTYTYYVAATYTTGCIPVSVASNPVTVTPINTTGCDDYIIGTGTTSHYALPTDYYNYSYSQQIYLSSEIDFSAGAMIEELSFQYTGATALNRPNMTFYLGNTSKTAFSGTTDWILLPQLQQVFQGTVVFSDSGPDNWHTIVLDTPFEYTGENLVVVCLNGAGVQGTSASSFRATTEGASRSIFQWSSTVLVNPASPVTANGITTNRNNMMFKACTAPIVVVCDDVVLKATNNGDYYDPLPGWYGFSRNIMLFEASELDGAGSITDLAFNIAQMHANQRQMNIYLMHTDAVTLEATYAWNTIKAQATPVYNAMTNFPATGWQTFNLDAPFAYNGTQNLLVLVEGTGCTTGGGCAARAYHSTKTNCHWYSRKDTTPPDDNALIGTRNSDRPNITFTVCSGTPPPTCNPPTNLNVVYNSGCSTATLTWNAPGKGDGKGSSTSGSTPTLEETLLAEEMAMAAAAARQQFLETMPTTMRASGIAPEFRAPLPKPETMPLDGSKATVFSEGFEGTTMPNLPSGWTVSTAGKWVTLDDFNNHEALGDDFPAHTGDRMMVNIWNTAGNNWAFSPGFTLTAGETYDISFWWNAMGWIWFGEVDNFEVRIGQTNTAGGMAGAHLVFTHPGIIYDFDFIWRQATNTFTPTAGGTYYLGFHDLRPQGQYGEYGLCIAIDDILITEGSVNPVPVSYYIYRDGTKIAGPIQETTYDDITFNSGVGHTWGVTQNCLVSESDPVEKSMPACGEPGDCNPITNLQAAYVNGCDVQLTWDAPTGKGGGKATQTFAYTGAVQPVELQPGTYTLEVWGADGGSAPQGATGKGGYSKGTITVTSPTTYYVYVGGKGNTASGDPVVNGAGGWNGGGAALGTFMSNYSGGTGGGGTDIRTSQNTTYADRIIVGGGGGGAAGYGSYTGNGGNGGGLLGADGTSSRGADYAGKGGTQTAGGAAATGGIVGYSAPGAFGVGGAYPSNATLGGTAGGGGWYGGGGGHWGGAAGAGSGYIGGVTGGVTIRFDEANFVANPDQTGNGYARITGGSDDPGDYTYNIYLDGTFHASTGDESYLYVGPTPAGQEWCVTVDCGGKKGAPSVILPPQEVSEEIIAAMKAQGFSVSADRLPILEGMEMPTMEIQYAPKAFADAYITNNYTTDGGAGYYTVDLATGARVKVGNWTTLNPDETPTGEDFDGTTMYRITNQGRVFSVTEAGATTLIGTISGTVNCIGLAYDWKNKDGYYFFNNIPQTPTGPYTYELYKISLPSLTKTLIGTAPTSTEYRRGLALHEDGFLYSMNTSNSASSNLLKVDPTTGQLTTVGPIGFPALYGFEIAYDRVAKIMYSCPIDGTGGGVNSKLITLNTTTGASTLIAAYGWTQHCLLSITKQGGDNPPTGESTPVCITLNGCNTDCPPITNLQAAYVNGCDVQLTWDAPTGKGEGKASGSITTSPPNNGSGGVCVDMIAGPNPITITTIEVPFASQGTHTVHLYYREGTACGYLSSSAGWTSIGQQSVVVTVGNTTYVPVPLPTPVTIPAGEMYGFYFVAVTPSLSGIRYTGLTTGTCGSSIIGQNNDITLKGGTGHSSPTAPFTGGSQFSERNFSGVVHYNIGGTGDPGNYTYNVYFDGTLVGTSNTESYLNPAPNAAGEWCVTVDCGGGKKSAPVVTLPTNGLSDDDIVAGKTEPTAMQQGNTIKDGRSERPQMPTTAKRTYPTEKPEGEKPTGNFIIGDGKGPNTVAYGVDNYMLELLKIPLDNPVNPTYFSGYPYVYDFVTGGDYANGSWYVVGEYNDSWGGPYIYKIDPATGNFTIAMHTIPNYLMFGMAYNDAEGFAYINAMEGYIGDPNMFYKVDLNTGATQYAFAVTQGGYVMYDISFTNAGKLIGIAVDFNANQTHIVEINTTNGALTILITAPFYSTYEQSLALDREDGMIYWTVDNFNNSVGRSLYRINLTNNTLTKVGNLPSGMDNGIAGLAIPGESTPPIPDGESAPVCVTLGACDSDCPPITNLQAEYVNGCDVQLTWDAPTGKGKGTQTSKITSMPEKPVNKADFNRGSIEYTKAPSMMANQKGVILSEGFENAPLFGLPTGWAKAELSGYDGFYVDDYDWLPNTGDQYVMNYWDTGLGNANSWLRSTGFSLEAGETYTISYYYFMGYDYGDGNNVDVMIGQSSALPMTGGTMLKQYVNVYSEWYENYVDYGTLYTYETLTFTPTASGTYYLAFHEKTPHGDGYDVVFDDILITGGGTTTPGDYTYNVYFDGTLVGTSDTETYIHPAPNAAGEWCVTVDCGGKKGAPTVILPPMTQEEWMTKLAGKSERPQMPTVANKILSNVPRDKQQLIIPGKGPNTVAYAADADYSDLLTFPLNNPGNPSYYPGYPYLYDQVSDGDYIDGSWYIVNTWNDAWGYPGFYKINPVTGNFTHVQVNFSQLLTFGFAYNDAEQTAYTNSNGGNFGDPNILYKVNLTTGALQQMCTITQGGYCIYGITFTKAGKLIGIAVDFNATQTHIVEINSSNGALTIVKTAPFHSPYQQSLALDREDGMIYWTVDNFDYTVGPSLYRINPADYSLTKVGNMPFGYTGLAIPGESTPPIPPDGESVPVCVTLEECDACPPIDNLVAEYVNGCKVQLTWNAPGGAGEGKIYSYTGAVQSVELDPGTYQIEAWGANGGGVYESDGGYSKGTITVTSPTTYYLYIGGKGGANSPGQAMGGWNGGGNSGTMGTYTKGGGGGGTDVRTSQNTTYADRIIVAGGGGGLGGNYNNSENMRGGHGGGLTGGAGNNDGTTGSTGYNGKGGTQTAGGVGGNSGSTVAPAGAFGLGGSSSASRTDGGGGGGWYGGGAGCWEGGGAGSGYIGGVNGGITSRSSEANYVANPDPSGNGYVIITELQSFDYNVYLNGELVGSTNTESYLHAEHVFEASEWCVTVDCGGGKKGAPSVKLPTQQEPTFPEGYDINSGLTIAQFVAEQGDGMPITLDGSKSCPVTLPHFESFEGYVNYVMPTCWTRPTPYSFTQTMIFPGCYTGGSPITGVNTLWILSPATGDMSNYAVTPIIPAHIHSVSMSFYMRREGVQSGSVTIGVMSDPNNIATFEAVQTFTPSNNVMNYYEINFAGTTLTGTDRHIAIKHTGTGTSHSYWFDDITITSDGSGGGGGNESIPVCVTLDGCDPCPLPSNLEVSYDYNCTVATLTWDDPEGKGCGGKAIGNPPTVVTQTVETGVREGAPSGGYQGPTSNQTTVRAPYERNPNGELINPFRGPNDIAYLMEAASGATKPHSITLGNPNSTVAIGGSLPGLPTGGEWIDGEWYCVNVQNSNIYKVNPATGSHTIVASHGLTNAFGLAHSVSEGVTYITNNPGGTSDDPSYFYKVDVTTGATEYVCQSDFVYSFVITNDGRFIGFTSDFWSGTSRIIEINPATGAFTTLANVPFWAWYVQDMAYDRDDDLIYWASCNGNSYGDYPYCTFNPANNQLTQLGKLPFEGVCFAIPYVANQNIAKKPDPFTVTAVGLQLKANLAWTNPTETVAGDPLTSIDKMVVTRGGTIIWQSTGTVTPGQPMTYVDTGIPNAGQYCYQVYAVTSEGDGMKATDCGVFGPMCDVTVIITPNSYYQDMYEWSLTNDETGATIMSGGAGSQTVSGIFSGSATFKTWQTGSQGDNAAFIQVIVNGEEVIYWDVAFTLGFSKSETVFCDAGLKYNVYLNGNLVAGCIGGNSFAYEGFNPCEPHVWELAVCCDEDFESDHIVVTMPEGCVGCYPPENLYVEYETEENCESAILTWDPPVSPCGKNCGGTGKTIGKTPTVLPQVVSSVREGAPIISAGLDRSSVYHGGPIAISDPSRNDGYIYGVQGFYGMPQEHVKISIANPGQGTTHSPWSDILSGEFYQDFYYCGTEFGEFYKVAHATGVATLLTTHPTDGSVFFNDLTYDYSSNTMYGLWGQNQLYSIDLNTGARTLVTSVTGGGSGLITIACNLAGDMYGIEMNGSGARMYSINKTTGVCTLLGSTGLPSAWAQSSSFDRETGIYYWCNYQGGGLSRLCTMNLTTGAATPINSNNIGEICGAYFVFYGNMDIAKAPNPFTVSSVGVQLKANLAWNNPTETLGGDPLTSIDKVVVKRGSDIIWESTGTVTPGQSMTYIDTGIPSAGQYCYSVYVVTSEGNGASAGDCDIFGPMCSVTVIITPEGPPNYYADSYQWSLISDETGATIISGGPGSQTVSGIFSGSATFKTWQQGSYYDNLATIQVIVDGEEVIYWQELAFINGFSKEEAIFCEAVDPIIYNVYYDGEFLGETSETTYVHKGFKLYGTHEWCVTAQCIDGGESDAACYSKKGCAGDCPPIENLQAHYVDINCAALLTWDEPEAKKCISAPIVVNEMFAPSGKVRENNNAATTGFGLYSAHSGTEPGSNGSTTFTPDDWVKWTTGAIDDALGNGWFPIDMIGAARFLTSDYAPLNITAGDVVSKVSFGIYNSISSAPYVIQIRQGGTSPTNPGVVEYEQTVTQQLYTNSHNEVELDMPYVIDLSRELWICIKVVNSTPGHYLGVDSGPGVANKGDIMCWNGEWMTLGGEGFNANWSIQAYVESGNMDLPKKPDPFTVSAVGVQLKAKLEWTNPTQTIGGDPLGSIDKMVVTRGGTIIWESTGTVTPGQSMTYTDADIPNAGQYCYQVYAVNSEGNGQKASDCDIIGNVCVAYVNITDVAGGWYGDEGDEFSWTITDDETGAILAGGGTQGGGGYVKTGSTLALLTTGSATFKLWSHDVYWQDNGVTLNITVNDEVVYNLSVYNIGPGYVAETDLFCEGVCYPTYNVYRDGVKIAEGVEETEYLDEDLDNMVGHTWCVTVSCCGLDLGSESPEVCTSLTACGVCDPIENLVVTQPKEGMVHFEWTIPTPPGFLGIKITRDGMIIVPLVPVPQLWYTDYVSVGNHLYCFTAIYDKPECTESEEVCIWVEVYGQCDAVDQVIATVIAADKVKLDWIAVTALGFVNYSVYRGTLEIGVTTQTTYTDVDVPVGAHTYSVVVNYTGKDCKVSEHTYSNPIVIETCVAVINLEVVEETKESITIAWEAEDDVEWFDVYRNSQLIGTVDETTYVDEGKFAEGVIYNYCVIPVYETCQVVPACVEAYIEPCTPDNVTDIEAKGDPIAKAITLTWNCASTDATFNITRNNIVIAEGVTAKTYVDDKIQYDVIYKYCVAPVSEECAGGAADCVTAVVDTPTPCNTVQGATAIVSCKSAVITWKAVVGSKGYKVSRDGVLLATVTALSYTENAAFDHGVSYTWEIVTVCDGNESDPAKATAYANCEGIDELINGIAIYPNPANTVVIIKGKDVVQLDIYNVVGQLVESIKSVEGEFISNVDVSGYASGTYVFKMHTSDRAIISRPIVIRH